MRTRATWALRVWVPMVAVLGAGCSILNDIGEPSVSEAPTAAGFAGTSPAGTPPTFGTTETQAHPPPAISGGTLLVLRDGVTAVASDPDRDAIYVVNLSTSTLTQTFSLAPGDEPGRVVED